MKVALAPLAAALLWASTMPLTAFAATTSVTISGSGIAGDLTLTYGPTTDAKYPDAFEVTGISGTFTDAAAGISNATILGLVQINHSTPEAANLLAPNDFSRFAVASGLDPVSNGFLSYDNLYWPGGAPQTASDYPAYGGIVDIYGLMFRVGDGKVVNFWSNGVFFGPAVGPIYGVAVATVDEALDYAGGISATVPEPASTALLLLGLGVTGLAARHRRRA
jgi:PEP-CTERM motif